MQATQYGDVSWERMIRAVVLSYFFPPCNLTASQRAYGWAKYLNRNGYYPIIITRSWDVAILKPEDALKKAGNKVVGIIGAKTKSSLTLEPQMRISCSRLIIATEDGTYERRGLASEMLKDVLSAEIVRHVYAVGSVEMLQAENGLRCEPCRLVFPIRDDIPVMLVEEARKD